MDGDHDTDPRVHERDGLGRHVWMWEIAGGRGEEWRLEGPNGEVHRTHGPARRDPEGAARFVEGFLLGGSTLGITGATREWMNEGLLHRDAGPAVEFDDGSEAWFVHGQMHRDAAPALDLRSLRLTAWAQSGVLHRVGGPALIGAQGIAPSLPSIAHRSRVCLISAPAALEWWERGRLHRLDGPAQMDPGGAQMWWRDGLPHRDDGPAYTEPSGRQEWWVNGRMHRLGGPASLRPGAAPEYWVEGERLEDDDPRVRAWCRTHTPRPCARPRGFRIG